MILATKSVMTLATLCFAIGYASRHRDNRLHRQLMLVGVCLFLAAICVVVAGIWGWGVAYRPAYWLIRAMGSAQRANWILVAHGVLGGVTLLALVVQAIAGIRRDPLHLRMFPFVLLLWAFTYVLGMLIFT